MSFDLPWCTAKESIFRFLSFSHVSPINRVAIVRFLSYLSRLKAAWLISAFLTLVVSAKALFSGPSFQRYLQSTTFTETHNQHVRTPATSRLSINRDDTVSATFSTPLRSHNRLPPRSLVSNLRAYELETARSVFLAAPRRSSFSCLPRMKPRER